MIYHSFPKVKKQQKICSLFVSLYNYTLNMYIMQVLFPFQQTRQVFLLTCRVFI